MLRGKGPLFLASNHPNSFLDAVIIASHCKRRTFILVRGDVFKKKWASKILRKLYCLPIYRISEGRNLIKEKNKETFSESLELFRRGNNILIFSEGICENEWLLRSLGKGTARLACRAWQDPAIPSSFRVYPVGITYNNFDRIGKKVFLLTGDPLENPADEYHPRILNEFNITLRKQLEKLIVRIPPEPDSIRRFQLLTENASGKTDAAELIKTMQETLDRESESGNEAIPLKKQPARRWKKIFFFPLALAGWIVNAPFYYPVRSIARRITRGTVYYDSVLFGILFFLYPIYVVILIWIFIATTGSFWWITLLAVLPFIGRLTVRHPWFTASSNELRYS